MPVACPGLVLHPRAVVPSNPHTLPVLHIGDKQLASFIRCRFSVASPAASKAGSMSVTGSQRLGMDGCDDDWEATSRAMPDVCSPGDQLPMPALDQDV